ncbi:hypothetical protein E4631_01125 [Hymenobacter sp. UV11]|uniref:hypothetical protein n=1 Tax=Hymenobacter sp. UV11 TaxID=1849735 RepID=UPI00105F3C6D|nr:hypothetical protein [Hymenobacter sp. UV11]TDN37504.1 hypothetical protein A8B98_02950 [Hymenobacter sp. UV11]TFZ68697.1 hypothetical protein E4631_01125 [Hymenobacter sp. UV11]
MRNTYTTPADFWQERDFGAKISATFEFIGMHWRPLGKCLVYFVLPVALLAGIGLGIYASSAFRAVASQQGRSVINYSSSAFQFMNFGALGLSVVGIMLGFLLLTSTLYAYVRARLQLPATEPITPTIVWAELRGRFGRLAQAIGLAIVVGLLLGGVVSMVFLGAVGKGKGGSGGSIMLAGILLPIAYIFMIYAGIALSLLLPVLWFEDGPIFASVGRCFRLIKGRWWATWGLLFVASIIQSMLTIVFALPSYALTAGHFLGLPGLSSSVLAYAGQGIYLIGFIFTYCVPLLALAFQYFNLVEQKDGYGTSLLVSQLGQPAPTAQSGYYQPDEEGEY